MGFKGGGSSSQKLSLLDEIPVSDNPLLQERHNLVGWSVIVHKGWQYRGFYNSSGQIVLQKVQLDSQGNILQDTLQEVTHTSKTLSTFTDDHKFITLHFFGNRLFVFYDMHATALKFFRITDDDAITPAGSNETGMSAISGTVFLQNTYFVCVDSPVNPDIVYIIFRDGTSGNGDERMIQYSISTDTFVAASGTFTSGGTFYSRTRSGGTSNLYGNMPFVDKANGLLIWAYHCRLDGASSNLNSDVNLLVYDCNIGQFRKTSGEVYTNSIQFDAASSTRAPEKIVDIGSGNFLATDYFRRQNCRLSDGTDVIVYQTGDSNGFRNVFVVRSKNGVPETPKQLTFFKVANTDDVYSNFINPALYYRNGKIWITFKDLKNYGQVIVLESLDGAKTFKNPYSISYSAGVGTFQNMDYYSFETWGKFYALHQEVTNNHVISEEGRPLSMFRWDTTKDNYLPYLSSQSLFALGELFVGSRNGNVNIFAGYGEVINLISEAHTGVIKKHSPSAVSSGETHVSKVRSVMDGITPARHVIEKVEQPTTINGGGLPTNIVLFSYEDAVIGTHKAVDAGGVTTSIGTVLAWEKRWVDDAGVKKLGFVPIFETKNP